MPSVKSEVLSAVSTKIIVFYFFFIIGGVGLSPLGTVATSGLLYKPQMIDEDDCGAIGGMKIGRGNRSTQRKPAPAPLCPPQISHDQTRARTPARRGGKPATNRLSYGAALYNLLRCDSMPSSRQDWCFRGTCCLSHPPWRRRQQFSPPKCTYLSATLYSVISQRPVILITVNIYVQIYMALSSHESQAQLNGTTPPSLMTEWIQFLKHDTKKYPK
jgi:hypothetical protein